MSSPQWYSSFRKPYLLGSQSTVVLSHMQGHGAYKPATDPDPVLKLEPEPNQSHSHSDSHSYHPDLAGIDYFQNSSGGGYEFDIFGSYPPQYSIPNPFQLHHGTPSGSSSSMPFEPHDFSSMFSTRGEQNSIRLEKIEKKFKFRVKRIELFELIELFE
ncbi:hypothetical protein J1N35_015414 [Gossypium stocksii]|uniref:Uncharacterized protein n=1 Tax=Gossypium stocksii TaxID=47602 RepID=A0A9D4A8J7_9ROSI|nr:hypothetical protein J1N35_015414 [Gossypium stocksii]